jgi:catechol 2,3-dioxygenase-like lactoylglutathione lyase family enzyme
MGAAVVPGPLRCDLGRDMSPSAGLGARGRVGFVQERCLAAGLDTRMDIVFVASVAVIAPDPAQSRLLYVDALGLPLAAGEGSEYWHSEQLAGTRHFGIWPLREAAQACFGRPEWPADLSVPQASIEFEVANAEAVNVAADELEDRGFSLLHAARNEPWGQTVARLLSAEGLVVGISFASWLHEDRERE